MKKKKIGTPEESPLPLSRPTGSESSAKQNQSTPGVATASKPKRTLRRSKAKEAKSPQPKKRTAKTNVVAAADAPATGAISLSASAAPEDETTRIRRVIAETTETPLEASASKVPGAAPQPLP